MNTKLHNKSSRAAKGQTQGRWRRFAAGLLVAGSLFSTSGMAGLAEAKDPREPVTATSASATLAETDIYERAL